MSAIAEEKENNKVVLDEENLEYKIEIATQTLERNIGFVTNCDSKTSIALAAFGVLLTIILTNEGLNEIFNIVKECIETKTCCNILYLLCFAGGNRCYDIGDVQSWKCVGCKNLRRSDWKKRRKLSYLLCWNKKKW